MQSPCRLYLIKVDAKCRSQNIIPKDPNSCGITIQDWYVVVKNTGLKKQTYYGL
jgi:hypothetical protein